MNIMVCPGGLAVLSAQREWLQTDAVWSLTPDVQKIHQLT